MGEVIFADIEYRLDFPCRAPLRGLPLMAPGRYVVVTPLTVALRLMEVRKDCPKAVGVILEAKQNVSRDVLDYTEYGGNRFKLPGMQTVVLEIKAELFSEVVENDWRELRPDLPQTEFKGILVSMEKNIRYSDGVGRSDTCGRWSLGSGAEWW